MYIASLGNADDEDQNVTWVLTVGNDGRTIGQATSVHVNSSPAGADTGDDSTSSADSAGLQHPDPALDADHTDSAEEEDQDEEGSSDEGRTDRATLPSVERSYAIPVLPVSRQEIYSPGLVLGVPSHGLPGLVSTVFESAHSDGTGCAFVSQVMDTQVSSFVPLQAFRPFCVLRLYNLHVLLELLDVCMPASSLNSGCISACCRLSCMGMPVMCCIAGTLSRLCLPSLMCKHRKHTSSQRWMSVMRISCACM